MLVRSNFIDESDDGSNGLWLRFVHKLLANPANQCEVCLLGIFGEPCHDHGRLMEGQLSVLFLILLILIFFEGLNDTCLEWASEFVHLSSETFLKHDLSKVTNLVKNVCGLSSFKIFIQSICNFLAEFFNSPSLFPRGSVIESKGSGDHVDVHSEGLFLHLDN